MSSSHENMPHYLENQYRDSSQQLIYILIISMLVVLGVVTLVLLQVMNRPQPHFYEMRPDHKEVTLKPYEEPNYLPATILNWASTAAVGSYTFNFANYEKNHAAGSALLHIGRLGGLSKCGQQCYLAYRQSPVNRAGSGGRAAGYFQSGTVTRTWLFMAGADTFSGDLSQRG